MNTQQPFTAETAGKTKGNTSDRINRICRINKSEGQGAAYRAKHFLNPVNPVNPVEVFIRVSLVNGYNTHCRLICDPVFFIMRKIRHSGPTKWSAHCRPVKTTAGADLENPLSI
jgi:hypothetical protein